MNDCPLCQPSPTPPLWQDDHCRVILAQEPDYPGFCRVIWHAHQREMTDLSPVERGHLMAVVWGVEAAIRETLQPDKVNLASLGNQVPHLHWHVIPRYQEDRHFPDAVWAAPQRIGQPRPVDMAALTAALIRHLGVGPPKLG